jgi:glycopeptide antibiotics resistance protein
VLKQVFFWLAIFWTGIVTFLCLVQLNNVPFRSVSNLDKLVHTFFHFVFTMLWFLFFKKQLNSLDSSKPLGISFLLSFVFGISIEILQELFTTTRHADVFDVLANLFGAILATLAIVFLNKYKESLRSH